MRQIKITSTDQLIDFIRETNLSLDYYQKIINTYTKTVLMIIKPIKYNGFTQRDKENLIRMIQKYDKTHIEKGIPMPSLILGK